MTGFSEKLHELCRTEAVEAVNAPEACAAMTVDLVEQLANAVAALTQGDSAATHELTGKIMGVLPLMILEKARVVRETGERLRARP